MPTIKPYTARLADLRYQLTGCVSEIRLTGFFFTLFAILKEQKRKNRKNSLQKKPTSTWLKVGTI